MRIRERSSGFTLIELMIVVAILAIIIVIVVPNLMNSKKAAVETRVIAYLRSIITVNEQYKNRFGDYCWSENDLINSGFMPSDVGVQSLEEYNFTYSSTSEFWSLSMDPADPGVTGDRYFYADASGVIRFESNGTADSTSGPLGE